ncbi:MAG: toll/interleukin-1 receptor domain-containing protein [Cyanobacteria bacterium P01_F01_bin.86]
MMYFTDLRSVGLQITEEEAYERLIESLRSNSKAPPEGTVYVAYIWHEATFADRIATALQDRGHQTWIATRHVPLGVRWFEEQVRALQGAKAMIVVINERIADGALLRTELDLAGARGIPILPVLADSVKGNEKKIRDLRTSVRAHDDTLILYNLQWFSSNPDWDTMISNLSKNIDASSRV